MNKTPLQWTCETCGAQDHMAPTHDNCRICGADNWIRSKHISFKRMGIIIDDFDENENPTKGHFITDSIATVTYILKNNQPTDYYYLLAIEYLLWALNIIKYLASINVKENYIKDNLNKIEQVFLSYLFK